jgi:hypothetical protein
MHVDALALDSFSPSLLEKAAVSAMRGHRYPLTLTPSRREREAGGCSCRSAQLAWTITSLPGLGGRRKVDGVPLLGPFAGITGGEAEDVGVAAATEALAPAP